ncbi:hypothetical protein AB0L85_31040 [Streptomyces sp. NPDC052051]|uniref:hypothetical protein n=1 Tax=Streptomyces sp. NPDC052051 TaxID=3154649 RepID=UPI003419CD6A
MTTTTARQELQDALVLVVRQFLGMTAQEIKVLSQQLAGGTRTRHSNLLLDTLARGQVLEHLVQAELSADAASSAAVTGYEDRTPWRPRLPNSPTGGRSLALQIAHACLKILASSDRFSITEAVERAVGYVCGPQLADWEYVCVNVTLEGAPSVDIGGWQLAAFDYAGDPLLPLTGAPGVAGDLLAPRALHEMHGFGLLRRPLTDDPVPVDDDRPRVLVWPVLALNLALAVPVVAGPRYLVEPGRHVLDPHLGWPVPSEVSRWGYTLAPQQQWPSYLIDRRQETGVAAFCRAFLAGTAGLDAGRLDQLARAADHFLFVNCHVLGNSLGGAVASPLHLSEAALKLTMALESLLGGGDGGHADLSRKMQQRAAVLVGADDEDRLQVRDTVRAGYAARSAYAHGGKDKVSDLQALRSVVCRVIVQWVVQAVHCSHLSGRHGGRDGLVSLLDDALLSHRLRQEHIVGPREAFRAAGGTPLLPTVAAWAPDRFRLAGPGLSPVDLV